MKKFTLGFLVGATVSAVVLVPLVFKDRHDKFQFGRNSGLIEARSEIAATIEKEFGLYDGHTPYTLLFSVKTTDVISTETNGVKTVRVIP
jgi:hypothetical protein